MLTQILAVLDELGLNKAEALAVLRSEEEILTMVKQLLGLTGEEEDETLLFVIQSIEGQILRYINWETLPEELENVLTMMVVSYYKSAGLGNTQAATGTVTSIRRGDVQTSFSNPSGASGSAQTFNLGTDTGDFFGWKTVLNEYRKLRW